MRLKEPVPGADLVTTIDRQMQYQVQTALQRAVRDNGAKGGTVVVMDPHSGDVYAMATYPGFDPNDFAKTDPELWRNRPVTDMFEPGSVNKIITAAAALETGAVSVTRRFHVPATLQVGQFVIHDSEAHPMETMTLGDIITHSSNVGAALVANHVGNDAMASYMGRFGYGHTTGLGFPGEAAGKVPTAWDDVIRAAAAYGQGVAVTPCRWRTSTPPSRTAGCGCSPDSCEAPWTRRASSTTPPHRPRIASSVRTRPRCSRGCSPKWCRTGPASRRRSRATRWPARRARPASSTRTAPTSTGTSRASWGSFRPGRPRLVIAVSLDEPRTVFGGVAAAPLFSEIARYAIQRLGIAAAPPVSLPPSALPAP